MDLTHRFTVPTSVDETWAHFKDIASVAECFPGATVTSVEGDSFQGSCKVKLGPIALVYNGSGHVRGEGRGGAPVRGRRQGQGQARERYGGRQGDPVDGRGRGRHRRRGADRPRDHRQAGAVRPRGDAGRVGQAARPVRRVPGVEARRGCPRGSRRAASRGARPARLPAAPAGRGTGVRGRLRIPDPGPASGPRLPPRDDALNLGATVLPVLAKSYWKQALAGLVVVGVVIWLVTRG